MDNKIATLKEELATVELDQRFEMVNATPDLAVVDIENFICSPSKGEEQPSAE
ncbi:hypothetical protein [Pelomonas sp. BJYL3]|uniref:hypothetical protein n=1 Tax=Pelomonas sp. BJYL3 TaxID=2976697 RepID=UPI0022B5526C|nr:hypothetical protein [Pelomonas sp. BJYL3]